MTVYDDDYTPISPRLFGDSGAWTWEVPTLWRGLADPEGPWTPPMKPWLRPWPEGHGFYRQIAYWAPLLTLTYGVLGWARPNVGVQRWIAAGRPTDGPALALLERWWGTDALALSAWAQRSDAVDH
jgi:hypothetical protein